MQEYIIEFDKVGFDGSLVVEKLIKEGIISIQETRNTDKPIYMDFMVISVDKYDMTSGAASVNGKNVIYNIDKLISILPGLVMTGIFGEGTSESKVFQIIIQILVSVPSLLTVKISEKEADCLYAIWKSLEEKNRITEKEGLLFINEYMAEHGRSLIEASEYTEIIRQLKKYGFIELVEGNIVIKEIVLCH